MKMNFFSISSSLFPCFLILQLYFDFLARAFYCTAFSWNYFLSELPLTFKLKFGKQQAFSISLFPELKIVVACAAGGWHLAPLLTGVLVQLAPLLCVLCGTPLSSRPNHPVTEPRVVPWASRASQPCTTHVGKALSPQEKTRACLLSVFLFLCSKAKVRFAVAFHPPPLPRN